MLKGYYDVYIDDIKEEENKVMYHFEGCKMRTAKLYKTKFDRKYFQIAGDRYYVDEFVEVV